MTSTPSISPPTPESSSGHSSPPDELAQLAAMTGYVSESTVATTKGQPATTTGSQDHSTVDEEEPLLDAEDLSETELAAAKTKTPFWSNPLAKAGFVAGLMGLAIGTVGIFLWSVNGNWNKQLAQQPKPVSPIANQTPTVDPQQAEVGRLKTVAALGTQAQTLQRNAKSSIPVTPSSPTRAEKPTGSVPAPIHSSQPVVYSSPQSYSQPVTPVPQSSFVPRSIMASPSVPAVNPQEAWRTAQALGSFGQTSDASPTNRNTPSAMPASDDVQSRYDADAAALLSGSFTRVVRILPGAIATATLKTPVIWAQDLKNSQQPQRFGLELTQPIRSADGMIALPTGTQMIARVDTISGSGLVELSVEAIVVPTDQGNRVINVAPGAILVAGQGGSPLMASNYTNPRKQLLGKDIEIALMGALGQVGTLLNRPLNENTTTSPYLSSTNVSNGRTNILGGLLQGGFGALHNQISQRQQQDVQAILNRPNIWYIPSDRPVQVLINSPLEVRL